MDEIFKNFLVQMTEREKKQEERDNIYQEQQEERIKLQEQRDREFYVNINDLTEQVKILTERQNGIPAAAVNVCTPVEVRDDNVLQLNQSISCMVEIDVVAPELENTIDNTAAVPAGYLDDVAKVQQSYPRCAENKVVMCDTQPASEGPASLTNDVGDNKYQ